VAAALKAGAHRVVAVELLPEVLEALSGPLADSNENTYRDDRAELVPGNARRFLESSEERYDFIVVSSVQTGLGSLRELFEPSQVLYTREAFEEMEAHLAPGGSLFLSRFTRMDQRGILLSHSVRELRRLGLNTLVLLRGRGGQADFPSLPSRGDQYLIVAQKAGGTRNAPATVENFFRSTDVAPVDPSSVIVDTPAITDDRPFEAGLLIANLGIAPLAWGAGYLALAVAALGVILALALRRVRRGGETLPAWLSVAAVTTGVNFMVLEVVWVYRLMVRVDVPMDATFLGMVSFGGLAAAGGLLLRRRSSGYLLGVAATLLVALVALAVLAPDASLFAIAGGAFLTGSLFPRILRGSDRRVAHVFVWDAYGTVWGGMAALLLLLVLGLAACQVVSGLALGIAAVATFVATRTDGVEP
jgi:hypothetical protein